MQSPGNTGALIAALAAGLLTSGIATTSQAGDTDKVRCAGINSCKGKSACNSTDHACAGMNGCKGKGWIETTAKECKAKGGKVEPATPMPAPKK